MYVINGREFNITQINANKFKNEIRDPKEAQELTQLLKKLNKEVSGISKGGSESYSEFIITDKTEKVDTLSVSKDGYNAYSASLQYGFEKKISADDAFYDNWTKSTGIKEAHIIGSGNGNDTSGSISLDSQNTVQRYLGSTKNATVKDPSVVGMEKDEFLSYVREKGLDKEISWSKVEEYLEAPASFATIDEYTDYAGAMFASLEQRINRDFSGSERTEQLDILNSTFDKTVNSYAEEYTNKVTSSFEYYGVDIDADKLKSSVTELMRQKRDEYREYVKNNEDFANLAGSEDKWLERDVRYMTDSLRTKHSPLSETKNGSLYSKNDVEALGYFAESQARDIKAGKSAYSYAGSYYNEEKIGFSLAMRYLSAESISNEFGVSDDVRSSIMSLVDNYADKVIEGCNAHQKVMREYSGHSHLSSAQRKVMYGELDRNSVYLVLNKAKTEYKNNPNDLLKVLKSTGDFAYKQYYNSKSDTAKSQLARYNISTDKPEANFFHEFYDDGRGTSYIGKALDKLKTFATAVKSHNTLFMAKADNSYFFSYKSLLGGLYNPISK